MLYQRIDFDNWGQHPEAHRADIARIAETFARDMRENPEATRADIWRELDGVLTFRGELLALCSELEREAAERGTPYEDFAELDGIDPEAAGNGPELAAEQARESKRHTATDAGQKSPQNGQKAAGDAVARMQAERTAEAAELAQSTRARVKLLNMLFRAACRELARQGFTLSLQEIANRKRTFGVSLQCMDVLAAAEIPKAERLTQRQTETLWEGLTRHGLISGSLAAFSYYFGPTTHGRPKDAAGGLKWNGNGREFGYFVRNLSELFRANDNNNPEGCRKNARGAEICHVFGRDYGKIYKYVAQFKDGQTTRNKALAQVFARLNTPEQQEY